MKRKIVHIDQEKCTGCGLCVNACHEGAIELVDGKAKLISDIYCDGLGDCLPACPADAIQIVEREAGAYSEEAVEALRVKKDAVAPAPTLPCGCPGTMAKKITREKTGVPHAETVKESAKPDEKIPSELAQWPVQLKLVNPKADYFKGADLLVAADCTAFAYGDFHRDFIKGHTTVIGCPKLDDNEFYKEKLTEILSANEIKSITVVRMEVPCCSGIVNAVKEAMLRSKTIVPYREVVVGIDGTVK
ncbi:ATP-binding protein [Candidatus Formimonas warabiya]|uniref:Ferredoxin n=1 Tax=Formimonas warabiya TaxID=1761012 RepID=A0A3G1KY44_FORW1|nr:4Fe-4S dicluster domain-containing protein [Candidatus Formimonas warabiya]ATW27279.1 ferredoxin [Candidatus Formimonas warabiya]